MSKKTYSPEVIISKLREAEVMQSQGYTQEEAKGSSQRGFIHAKQLAVARPIRFP